MKKTFLMMGLIATISSCTIYRDYQITGEPIGTKTGVAKSKIFGSTDFTIKTAAENGDISKIGAVEISTKMYFIFPITKTKVYGE
jgi:hypothetical protein